MSNHPKPGTMDLTEPCTECAVPCTFEQFDYALQFGHIYSLAGLRDFMVTGRCEWCQDIMADFAAFSERKDLAGPDREFQWWDAL